MINGIINVYKEKGYTSHDVVAKLRGILKQKKIGHTGTLDPDATGVLPVCLGTATGVCDLLTNKDKKYRTVMLLGVTTDTQDISGTQMRRMEVRVTEAEIIKTIVSFIGEYGQIPPMYSALKVNGKKLCDLARKGIVIEREPRNVTIYEMKVINVNLPRVTMEVSCSKGTYIRTLIHDIGQALGCGACMEKLERTEGAGFKVENALTLEQIRKLKEQGILDTKILRVDAVFDQYPRGIVSPSFNKLLYNGNRLNYDFFETLELPIEGKLRVYDWEGAFIGLYEADRVRGDVKPIKMFMDRDRNGIY